MLATGSQAVCTRVYGTSWEWEPAVADPPETTTTTTAWAPFTRAGVQVGGTCSEDLLGGRTTAETGATVVCEPAGALGSGKEWQVEGPG